MSNLPAGGQPTTRSEPLCSSSKAIKGCGAGMGLLLKQVIQKHSWCVAERENIDRRKEDLQALENHAASGSGPCQMCHVLDS